MRQEARNKKQELETLMMYWWLHDMDGDTGHRKEYLATTYPECSHKKASKRRLFYADK